MKNQESLAWPAPYSIYLLRWFYDWFLLKNSQVTWLYFLALTFSNSWKRETIRFCLFIFKCVVEFSFPSPTHYTGSHEWGWTLVTGFCALALEFRVRVDGELYVSLRNRPTLHRCFTLASSDCLVDTFLQ